MDYMLLEYPGLYTHRQELILIKSISWQLAVSKFPTFLFRCVSKCVSKLVSMWLNKWVTEWVSEWVKKWNEINVLFSRTSGYNIAKEMTCSQKSSDKYS